MPARTMLPTSDLLFHDERERERERGRGRGISVAIQESKTGGSHIFLLHVSPPLLQFLPGAKERPNLPLMPHASSGVATHEIVKPRGFAAPLLHIIKGLLRTMPDSGLVRVRSTQFNAMRWEWNARRRSARAFGRRLAPRGGVQRSKNKPNSGFNLSVGECTVTVALLLHRRCRRNQKSSHCFQPTCSISNVQRIAEYEPQSEFGGHQE